MTLDNLVLSKLAEHWPAAFGQPTPLKIGIYDDLCDELQKRRHKLPSHLWRFTKVGGRLSEALGYWTHTLEYLAKEIAGAPRVDLDGNVVGCVSEKEAEWARDYERQKIMRLT